MRSGVELNTSSSPPSSQLHSLSLGLDPLFSPPFLRPSPKSAGSASLPSAPLGLSRSASWESDDKRGRSGTKKSLGLTKLEVDEGPFSDPLRSPSTSAHEKRSSMLSTTNDPLSLPPTPDCNWARRGSTLSTSSMSHSPSSPMGIYVPSTSRQRYSIASSSYANTIGDLSTSSMPLLRQSKGGDETSSSNGVDLSGLGAGHGGRGNGQSGGDWQNRASSYAASSSSRVHMAESSRASLYSDDASSVHSYPPKPRQRTGSTWTTSENGEGSRGSWGRDFESLGATSQIQRRGSADSRTDVWPPFVSNSYLHQPIARPTPAYLSQLSNYSFPPAPAKIVPPRSTNPPPPAVRTGGLGSSNPLAPLRKRLARSLAGSGGHLHTEVQLLLELVDALDHCITLFSTQEPFDPSTLSPVSRPPHPPSLPVPFEQTSTPSIGPTRNSKSALLDEVRLLVRELVELVPDAQRCITNGQYGPLAFPNTTTTRLMQSLENKAIVESPSPSPPILKTPRPTSWKTGTHSSDWWPSRLARDCRSLLVEAGLPTGKGSTVWQLAARLSEEGLEEEAIPPSTIEPTMAASQSGGGGDNTPIAEVATRQRDESPNLLSARSESARRDELLEQGKKRWEAYRQKQQQKGQKGGGGQSADFDKSFSS